MKRKLSARQITLISLICALICAVIAGFAFMNLFDSNSKFNNTASASGASVACTKGDGIISYGTLSNGRKCLRLYYSEDARYVSFDHDDTFDWQGLNYFSTSYSVYNVNGGRSGSGYDNVTIAGGAPVGYYVHLFHTEDWYDGDIEWDVEIVRTYQSYSISEDDFTLVVGESKTISVSGFKENPTATWSISSNTYYNAVVSNDGYSITITAKKACDYQYFYCTYSETKNYRGGETDECCFKVIRKGVTVPTLSKSTGVYSGATVSGLSATTTYNGSNQYFTLSTTTNITFTNQSSGMTKSGSSFYVKNASSSAYTVTLSLPDVDAYCWGSNGGTTTAPKTLSITVNKATPTGVSASVQAGTYYIGNKLSTVGISGTSSSVSGTFAWTSPDTVLTASGKYGWTFTPNDDTNYANVTGNLTVTAIAGLEGITLKNAKTSYVAYEAFNTAGMTVTASYANGSSNVVTPTSITTAYTGTSRNYFLVADNNTQVTISYTEGGTTKTATVTVTVDRATYNMSSVGWNYINPFTYDGTEKTVTLQNLPTGVTANYSNNKNINAGTYTASVSSWNYDTVNYNAPSAVSDLSWAINRAGISQPTYTPATVTYSATDQNVTLSSVDYMTVQQPTGWGLSGAVITIPGGTTVGSYTVTVTPDNNHKWSSGANVEDARDITVAIGKATYNMTGASWDYTTAFTYDGTEKTVTVQNLPTGVKALTYSDNAKTEAGNYVASVTEWEYDDENYNEPAIANCNWAIGRATQTITVDDSKTTFTYNGKLQTVTGIASVKDSEQTVKYADNEFTTVAEGKALKVKVYVEASTNYAYAEVFVTITVNKAEVSLTWDGGNGVYDGKEHNATLTVVKVFDRDASTFTTDTLKPYLTVSYTTEGGDEARKHVGTYAPSYTGYPDGEPFCNYTPVVTNPAYTFEITKAEVTDITFEGDTFDYNGTAHTIAITGTLPAEVTVKYTLNGKEFTGATDAGTYDITAEFACESGNYKVPASLPATMKITPRTIANDEVSGVDSAYTYKGEAWKPEPVVELTLDGATGSTTLVADTDYTVAYDTEVYVAGTTVNVTVTGKGNYAGSVTKTFTIEKATITREWAGESFTYTGEGQGLTVSFSGIAESDKTKVVPKVIYQGSGSTVYAASEELPVDAGNYTATIIFELNDNNYISKIINNEFKRFTIMQAHLDVAIYVEEQPPYYAGGALPFIGLDGWPIFNNDTVEGSIGWQLTALKAGTKDYVWVFTPDNKNFAQTTGTYTLLSEVIMPDITGISVEWKSGKPDFFTSTTLDEVREWLVVKGVMGNGTETIDIADYQLRGSWGSGDKPTDSEAKGYTLTVTVTVGDSPLYEFIDVYYNEVALDKITVTPVGGGSIKTSYEAFDTFDKTKVTVTAIYSDGKKVVVEDYVINYPDGRDCFWAKDVSQVLTVTYDGVTSDEISVSVSKKTYDLSAFGNLTVTYDGEVKSYAINGTFGIGKVDYLYGQYDENGEWQTVSKSNVKNAGTYYVRIEFTIVGEENIANYNAIDMQEVTLTINKAVYDNVDSIGFVMNSADYDFGNSLADKMTVQNVPDGVAVVYEYKDASGKTLTADEVINAGVYTVTARFVTDENHSGIAPMTNKFTVNKAKPAVNPIVGGSLSKGTKLSQLTFADDIAVKGTFKWVNGEQELQAGVNRCHYVFTPDDTANYETVSGYIDLSVGSVPDGTAANGGNLSAGLTAAIIVGMAACLFVAVIALIVAMRKPKSVADSDGFYDDVTAEDLQ